MIRAARTLEADIGSSETVKYRLALDKEHAAMLAKILEITKLSAADWLAHVLREELLGLGVEVPPELDWKDLLEKHKEETNAEPRKPEQQQLPGT
jgi:hypothetical protein